MHHLDLILTMTGGLAAALALGFGMHKIGLSPIVGYLLAGVLVGPSTPGFVADGKLAGELAEIGVILLMFGVGLGFHFNELMSVKRIAIPGALGQIAVATALGTWLAHHLGYSLAAGIVYGIAISVASTVVLVRVLSDHKELHTKTGRVALGWLVLEDLFTVVVLVVLPLLYEPKGASSLPLWQSLSIASLKLVGFVVVMFLVGRTLIPKLFRYVAETRSRELFTLTVLVSALGIAVGAAKLFGASMALGAFLAGMIVGQSEFSARAASEALPMRDAFAVLFFVSVGMLFDPRHLLDAPLAITLTLAIVLIGKPLAAWLIMRALGADDQKSRSVSVVLAQIGEFSFLLASTAQALGILPAEAASTLVAASIVSIAINPVFFRLMQKKKQGVVLPKAAAEPHHLEDRAVVVGYGPTGQVLVEILADNGIGATVIDLNLDTVRGVHQRGGAAVYGDAMRPEVLEEAGIARARGLFLTSASLEGAVEVIRVAKQMNPALKVHARTDYLRDVKALDQAGCEHVFAAEGEVALAMAATLLATLGATPEHIDRERDRVHQELGNRMGLPRPHGPPAGLGTDLAS